MAYFNPWRNALDRDCHTCRFSIGVRDGTHLWCCRHQQVTVFGCGWWEREPGTEPARKHLRSMEEAGPVR